MARLKLPIGIQSFSELRLGGYAYVDKTPFIPVMAEGKYFFLSRPRRFGKSLFLDTLDCAFSGRQDLFRGLYLDKSGGWDWDRKYPVVRISFGGSAYPDLKTLYDVMNYRLLEASERLDVVLPTQENPALRLHAFLKAVQASWGIQVVVLIDEYDKPILDNLQNLELAVAMREALKGFYSVLKDADPYLRFVFLTGVSKFSKTGIFSGLNNLNDITVDKLFSALCGYTQADVETVFAEYLANFDKEQVRTWYNGYSWTGEKVYNPFDLLLLFQKGIFKSHWFETGTPSFLVKLWKENPRNLPELEGLVVGEELLGSFEIGSLQPETLLFQAGYLTIKDTTQVGARIRYVLGFPNLEVRSSFSQLLLSVLQDSPALSSSQSKLAQALENGDTESLRLAIHAFFASIPHQWYTNNPISRYEGYYSSVFYAFLASLGWDCIPEDATNKGRLDLTVKTPRHIWLFEFKVRGIDQTGEEDPLAQLVRKGYAEKYATAGLPIHQVGIVFDTASRNIQEWKTAE